MKLKVKHYEKHESQFDRCKGCIQESPFCEIRNLTPWNAVCIKDFVKYYRGSIVERSDSMECNKCELYKGTVPLPGEGPKSSKVMLIGMCPGEDEERLKRIFVGKSGKLLSKSLYSVGLKKIDLYISNLVKCRVKDEEGKNRPPTKDEAELCAHYHLDKEIQEIKPELIVPLGADALKYVSGSSTAKITKVRGKAVKSEKYGCLLFPTYHPSAILRNPDLLQYFNKDLSALKEIMDTGKVPEAKKGNYLTIDSEEKLESLWDKLSKAELFTIDIETSSLNFLTGRIIGVSFSWKEGTGVYLPLMVEYKSYWKDKQLEVLAKLKEAVESNTPKVLQNFPFDIKFFRKRGMQLNNVIADTILMAHLYNENMKGRYNLDDLASEFVGMTPHKDMVDEYRKGIQKERNKKIREEHKKLKKEGQVAKDSKPSLLKKDDISYADIPLEILAPYACLDTDKTLRIYNFFNPLLEKMGLSRLFNQVTMPLAKIMADVEYQGIKVDTQLLAKLERVYGSKVAEAEASVYKIIGREINLQSNPQMQKLLFEELKLPPLRKSKTGYSTDEETLLSLKGKHEVVDSILAFRAVATIYATYVIGIKEKLDKEDKIHANYLLFGTTSGRFSCEEPNMQNLPTEGYIRNLFIPDNKDNVILDVDFEQAEVRVMANESGDQGFMEVFEKGEDIHSRVASEAMGISYEDAKKDNKARTIGKGLVFGMNYGRGPKSIALELGIDEKDAERFQKNYLAKHKGLRDFMTRTKATVHAYKEVVNMFGRRRRLLGIDSEDFKISGHCEREAINFLIQSTTHDILSVVTIRVYNRLKKEGYKTRIINEVHDELVFDVPKTELEGVMKLIKEEMERPVTGMRVQMKVELKSSDKYLSKDEETKEELKDVPASTVQPKVELAVPKNETVVSKSSTNLRQEKREIIPDIATKNVQGVTSVTKELQDKKEDLPDWV